MRRGASEKAWQQVVWHMDGRGMNLVQCQIREQAWEQAWGRIRLAVWRQVQERVGWLVTREAKRAIREDLEKRERI